MRPDSPASAWIDRLLELAKACIHAQVADGYSDADDKAIRGHRRHRILTIVTCATGAAALLLSIVHLADAFWTPIPNADSWFGKLLSGLFERLKAVSDSPPWIEFGLVLLAGVSVLVGRNQESWLYWRYRAERFRSLSFKVIIDPLLWTSAKPQKADWQNRVHAAVDRIQKIAPNGLENAAASEEAPEIPAPADCGSVDPDLLRTLARHYLDHRLDPQIRYFERRIEKQESGVLDNPLLLPVVFFGSIVFVLIHLAFEASHRLAQPRFAELSEVFDRLSGFFLFVSAVIPTLWTAFRTWRAANEHSRNAARSRAKLDFLRDRSVSLEKDLARKEPDAFRMFTTLALSESLLRNELLEWLRLMLAAEWYG